MGKRGNPRSVPIKGKNTSHIFSPPPLIVGLLQFGSGGEGVKVNRGRLFFYLLSSTSGMHPGGSVRWWGPPVGTWGTTSYKSHRKRGPAPQVRVRTLRPLMHRHVGVPGCRSPNGEVGRRKQDEAGHVAPPPPPLHLSAPRPGQTHLQLEFALLGLGSSTIHAATCF